MNTQSGQSHRAVQFGVLGLLGGIVLAVVVRFIIIADAPTIPRDPEPVLQPAPTDPTAWALASPVFQTSPVKPSPPVLPPPPILPDPPVPPATQEYPLVGQRNTQQYEAAVQRIKSQYETDVEQAKQKHKADVERYQQEMQQYETAVRRKKEEHEAAIQRYPQQLEEYNAASQRYTIKHQAWQQAIQDVERREKQAAEETRRTANMWFWIVLIAMPVTSALFGGTIAVTEIVSVHVESAPADAEIFVDGDFVGYSPVDFQIAKGKHVLCIDKQDYQRWERSISAVDGMKLAPTLEKATTPSTLTTTRQEAVKPSHTQGQSRKWALRGLLIIVVCAVGLLGVSIIVDHLTAGSMWFLIYWRSFGISW